MGASATSVTMYQFATEDCTGVVESSVDLPLPDVVALGSCNGECCCFATKEGGSQHSATCTTVERHLSSHVSDGPSVDGAMTSLPSLALSATVGALLYATV